MPGYLTVENAQVDKLVAFSSAQEEHEHLHTNANHLHVQYKIPFRQAKQIILNCPICCPLHIHSIPQGVNPRGSQSNEIWQMDVTHIPEFGHLSFLHVTIDTLSSFI